MSQEQPQPPPSRALHPAPAYNHAGGRHHPYAPSVHRHHSSATLHPHAAHQQGGARRISPPRGGPPSPPRSRRDDDSPPLPNSKFDPADNYWEDVPPAPASLKMILDSFRRSGEGDRDLLLSILGAKKSEEERLTAIIQTRLTLLQARLNISAIQAQATLAMPAVHAGAPMSPRSPDGVVPPQAPARASRTESFTSQASDIPYYMHPGMREMREREREREREERDPRERDMHRDPRERERERIQLPAPVGYGDREREAREFPDRDHLPPIDARYPVSPRRGSRSESTGSAEREREREREPLALREREREHRGEPPLRERDGRDRDRTDRRAGLDMLLEGVREAEREST